MVDSDQNTHKHERKKKKKFYNMQVIYVSVRVCAYIVITRNKRYGLLSGLNLLLVY